MLPQAGGGALVFRHQQLAQHFAHVLHPQLPHWRLHPGFGHHPLQCANVVFRAQRIAFGLHTAQALCRADQGVEFRQHSVGGMRGQLLCPGQLHLVVHLGFVHERKLTEIHAGVVHRACACLGGPFGKNFEQGHRIGLGQGGLVLGQQPQRITHQRTPLNIAGSRLLPRQSALGDFDQLHHECFARAHGVDDTGTEHRSRSGRS